MSQKSRHRNYPKWSKRELTWIVLIAAAFAVAGGALLQWSSSAVPSERVDPAASNRAATARTPQGTIPPEQFAEPRARLAYAVAARISRVLAELPCYCGCDHMGHKNLLDCFKDEHAENCIICQDSAFWAEKRVNEHASAKAISEELKARYSRHL